MERNRELQKSCKIRDKDYIKAELDTEDGEVIFITIQGKNENQIILCDYDAADFCHSILQELFKDKELEAEMMRQWGYKPAEPKQPEWAECPDEEIKSGDYIKCIDNAGCKSHLTYGKIYKCTMAGDDKSDFICLEKDDDGDFDYNYFRYRFVKVVQK